jgi:hypothetical protein
MTIYEKTPGALIATGERTVATFESGLVRVDQSYVSTNAAAPTNRATLAIGDDMPDGNEAPAIDGLKIFPHPQEITRQDGFTEFRVSAYGRITETLQNVTQTQVTYQVSTLWRFRAWDIAGSIVVPAGTAISAEQIPIDENLLTPFGFWYQSDAWEETSVVYQTQFNRAKLVPFIPEGPGSTVRVAVFTPVRSYLVTMTNRDTAATFQITAVIEDPIWDIATQRNFGAFSELELASRRDIPTLESV